MHILNDLEIKIVNELLYSKGINKTVSVLYDHEKLFLSDRPIKFLEDLKILQTNFESLEFIDGRINMIKAFAHSYESEPLIKRLIAERNALHHPDDLHLLIESARQILKIADPDDSLILTYYGYSKDFAVDLHRIRMEFASDLRESTTVGYSQALEEALLLTTRMHEQATINNSIKLLSAIKRSLSHNYLIRIEGERLENLRMSEKLAEEALKMTSKGEEEYAECHNTLANVFGAYAAEGIEEEYNCRKAIMCGEEALTNYNEKKNLSKGLAYMNLNQFHNQLGELYLKRGLRTLCIETLDHGLNYGNAAIKIFEKENYRFWLGNAKSTVGDSHSLAYIKLDLDFHEKAIQMYEEALECLPFQSNAYLWAKINRSLGSIYYFNRNEDFHKFTNKALEYYNLSLKVFSKNETPFEWAMVQRSIGYAYNFLFKRTKGRNFHNMSIIAFESALEIFTPTLFPEDFIDIAHYLAEVYYFNKISDKDIEQAYRYCIQAHEAVENLRAQSSSQNSKFNIAWDNMKIYKLAVHLCLLLGKPEEAFMFACASKGRSFVDLINTKEADIEQVIDQDEELKNEWKIISEIRQEIAELEIKANQAIVSRNGHPEELARLSKVLKERRAELRKFMNLIYLNFPQVSTVVSSPPLAASELLEFCKSFGKVTFIDYYFNYGGLGAFIFNNGKLSYINLAGAYGDMLQEVNDVLSENESHYVKLYSRTTNEINDLFGRFYQKLIEPITTKFQISDRLLISPMGDLHKIPFALAFNQKTGRYLIDDHTITNIPGITALHSLMAKKAANKNGVRRFQNILTVTTSSTETTNPLKNAVEEALAIESFFEGEKMHLQDVDAKPETIIAISKKQSFSNIHFSCHGSFDLENPESSGLHLYEKRILTTEQIQTELRLQGMPLISLGACKSGINKFSPGDQATGLNTSFLSAGARATVSSLWCIDDSSARNFYKLFYQGCVKEGLSESESLRAAMIGTRESAENWLWSHPFHWAAFQLTGIPDFMI